MTRAQLILTVSAIVGIIAFTVGVKIMASNTTAPPIQLPPGATGLPVARMAPPEVAPRASAPPPPAAMAPMALAPPPQAQAPSSAPPAPAGVVPVALPVPPKMSLSAGPPTTGATASAPSVSDSPPAGFASGVQLPPREEAAGQPMPAPPLTPETDRREAIEMERRQQANGALNSLLAAQHQLSTGDTAGVDQALAAAAASMNAVGQGALQQARTALANKDLAGASLLINQAVVTASATPPVQ